MVALKGQNHAARQPVVLPFQGESRIAAFSRQGVALGWHVSAPSGREAAKRATSKPALWASGLSEPPRPMRRTEFHSVQDGLKIRPTFLDRNRGIETPHRPRLHRIPHNRTSWPPSFADRGQFIARAKRANGDF
jgi:hypothetical protein